MPTASCKLQTLPLPTVAMPASVPLPRVMIP